jgi:uncharacterized protein YjiS (DUF1127 family)
MVTVMVTLDTIEFACNSNDGASSPAYRGKGKRLFAARAFQVLTWWWMKRSTRAQLEDLDEALLKDIGVTRQEARVELKKSIYLR